MTSVRLHAVGFATRTGSREQSSSEPLSAPQDPRRAQPRFGGPRARHRTKADEFLKSKSGYYLIEEHIKCEQPATDRLASRAVSDELGGGRGVYSIGAVARMLGIPAATIRNWEERYGTIVPERSPGGHRLYSRDQMEQLRFIAAEVSRGLSAADAHRLLAEQSEGGQPWRATVEARARGCSCCSPNAIPWPRTWRSSSCAPRAMTCTWRWRSATPRSSGSRVGPQLAIVELMISGGRGAELCRRLKQHDAGAVLAISVLQARDEALAAGADAFLQKPLDPLEFVSTVKDLLGASALVARRGHGESPSGGARHERRRRA